MVMMQEKSRLTFYELPEFVQVINVSILHVSIPFSLNLFVLFF